MYSWGNDTNAWKNPGTYDFGSARRTYLDKAEEVAAKEGPRTYIAPSTPKLALVDPKGRTITSNSENPILVLVDGTQSMQDWPAKIFDRLPLMYQTLTKYRKDVEISFSVIGDANNVSGASDKWPVQVGAFAKGPGESPKGKTLDDYLKALTPEGGGGPGIREDYELWAYFIKEFCTTPKATSPFLIIMGDEKFYDVVSPALVKEFLGRDIEKPVDSVGVWKTLASRYNTYFLQKPLPPSTDTIGSQWKNAIGSERVIPVYDPERVVDIAIGLIAKEWGALGDFAKNMSARQDQATVGKVLTTLRSAPGLIANANSADPLMKSGTNTTGIAATPVKKSIKLLEDKT